MRLNNSFIHLFIFRFYSNKNVSVTYVTLVPWRRERRRHVPSPRLLYHRWGPRLGSSAKTWICAAPAAYLCSRCDQRQLDAIIACQCALARLVYTRSGLVSLSDIPIRRSSDVTSPFPPSGNEGYIRNRDVPYQSVTLDVTSEDRRIGIPTKRPRILPLPVSRGGLLCHYFLAQVRAPIGRSITVAMALPTQ